MAQLELYYKPTCPYCLKVLQYIQKNNIEIPLKNIQERPEYRDHLIDVGGKGQVPCLFIDGKPMYESDDIIQWLSKNTITTE